MTGTVPLRKTAPLAVLIAAAFFVLVAAWHDPEDYGPDRYHDDVNWCMAHGYEADSSGVNQPVTCTEDGQDVAIPPGSLNRLKERQ